LKLTDKINHDEITFNFEIKEKKTNHYELLILAEDENNIRMGYRFHKKISEVIENSIPISKKDIVKLNSKGVPENNIYLKYSLTFISNDRKWISEDGSKKLTNEFTNINRISKNNFYQEIRNDLVDHPSIDYKNNNLIKKKSSKVTKKLSPLQRKQEIIKKLDDIFNIKSSISEETKSLVETKQDEIVESLIYWLKNCRLLFEEINEEFSIHGLKEEGIDILLKFKDPKNKTDLNLFTRYIDNQKKTIKMQKK
jgi:hypothetical protein